MAEHLEDLIAEHLDWLGYVVKRNVLVGKRANGGWEMELDIIAYHPSLTKVVHVEPSLDAHTWARREERFRKKFEAGKRFAFAEVFPWLEESAISFEQLAIVTSRGAHRASRRPLGHRGRVHCLDTEGYSGSGRSRARCRPVEIPAASDDPICC